MKRIHIAVIVVCALPVFAQAQDSSTSASPKTTAKKKKTAAAPQAGAQLTIPKGAVLDAKDDNYHFTDKSGRKWVYMMTPMGASRWEDKGPAASTTPAQPETTNRLSGDPNLKAIEQGDTVKFVRSTPFGNQSWTKKKSELTEDERSMITGSSAEVKAGEKPQN